MSINTRRKIKFNSIFYASKSKFMINFVKRKLMTFEEANSQIRLCFMQLDLMRTYDDELIKRFGKRGFEERIDIILDKLIIALKIYKKYKSL